MVYGICLLSVAPVRKEPWEQSEMVTQILFGELCEIIEKRKNWLLIITLFDRYEGWVDDKMIHEISEKDFSALNQMEPFVLDSLCKINIASANFYLLPGSSIYGVDKSHSSFRILDQTYFSDEFIHTSVNKSFKSIAEKFLNTPYLWGGRSLFGIDCSGFTQLVYKIKGLSIARDASQQVKQGETIDFIANARTGDLAFFDNEEGRITHVGLVLDQGSIIHASGQVRIDRLDHQGIFNQTRNLYTHKLRIIKRIVH